MIYKELIIDIIGKINNPDLLKRIYNLAQYLYVTYDEEE